MRTSLSQKCQHCPMLIAVSNMAQHVRKAHRVKVEHPPPPRSSPNLGDAGTSDTTDQPSALQRSRQPSQSEVSNPGSEQVVNEPVATNRRTTYACAAVSLLDQHRRFCEPDLMQFLSDTHPEIPTDHRFPLLIGAMAGAQFAAQLHVFAEHNRSSGDHQRRRSAHNAMAALTDWNFGLRVGTRPAMPIFHSIQSIVDPLSPQTPEETLAISPPEPTSSAQYRMMELHLPVDYEQSNRDFTNEASSLEGDRMIVAETPPSAQLNSSRARSVPPAVGVRDPVTEASSPYEPRGVVTSTSLATYNPTPIGELRRRQTTTPAAEAATTSSLMLRASHSVTRSALASAPPRSPPSPRMSTSERYRGSVKRRTSPRLRDRDPSQKRHHPSPRHDRARDVTLSRDEYDRLLRGTRRDDRS